MTHSLQFDRRAQQEIDEAYEWYRSKNREVATRFIKAVRSASQAISNDPERCTMMDFELGIRRYTLKKFPYNILFSIEPSQIFVIAVAHHSRHPDYWKQRLQ